jgi:NAD+ synthase
MPLAFIQEPMSQTPLHDALRLDPAAEVDAITAWLRAQVFDALGRRGAVVAISGGIDSAVCAGLAARAFGPDRVFGLLLPERDSSPESEALGREWAQTLGIPHEVEDVTATLEAAGCYARRDAAVRRVVPEYGPGWRFSIGLPEGPLDGDRLSVFSLAVAPPAGEIRTVRLPAREYREIVAATNFKQRVRKMAEYYHADRLHYAVIGTPNRLEYDQGFFVKGGDGLADVKPIAHLFKAQVYQLAEYLGVPEGIRGRTPTTDTYTLPQTQDFFFFAMPARLLDLVLLAYERGVAPAAAAAELGLTPQQAERAYRHIERKRAATRYLHKTSLLVRPVGPPGAIG